MLFDGARCWIWQSAKTSTQFTQLVLVRDQVEHLDRRVQRMHFPNAYAHLVYGLRLHINLVRSRL